MKTFSCDIDAKDAKVAKERKDYIYFSLRPFASFAFFASKISVYLLSA